MAQKSEQATLRRFSLPDCVGDRLFAGFLLVKIRLFHQSVLSARDRASCSNCWRATIGMGSRTEADCAGACDSASSIRFTSKPPAALLPLNRFCTSRALSISPICYYKTPTLYYLPPHT